MLKKTDLTTLIRENKTLCIIITVGLFLIELEIFAVAAVKSGRKSWLQIYDDRGAVVYETDGARLSDFNKYYFEKTFGPFENYDVKLVTRDVPFPFRAWFTAALGIPIGAVLMFGFVFKAWLTLFHGERTAQETAGRVAEAPESRVEQVLNGVGRLNIFTIGALVFLAVVAYWAVPNSIAYIGRAGLEALGRHRWLFFTVAGAFLAVVLWIIYLRYLLAKKAIESQAEVDKYRLQLEHKPSGTAPQLEYQKDRNEDPVYLTGEVHPEPGVSEAEERER